MYQFGRALQFAGLTILPLAIFFELQHQVTLWQMLTLAAFGATLFSLGYILSGLGNRSS